jgi:multicomponent Na+:H+ antiporter subunit C
MNFLLTHFNYLAVIVLMMGGLFITFSTGNLIKRMIGLAIFQTSVGLFYITLGKVAGGTAAITIDAASKAGETLSGRLHPDYVAAYGVDGVVYSNPLPHVLILTAIVVGVATLSVGLAIAVRVRESYGTVEMEEIGEQDAEIRERMADTPRSGGRPS